MALKIANGNTLATTTTPGVVQPNGIDILIDANGVISAVTSLYPYKAISSAYTIVYTDFQIECTANSFTVSLPTAVGIQGKAFSLKNSGAGTVTLAANGAELIDGESTQTLTQYDNLLFMSNNVGWIIL